MVDGRVYEEKRALMLIVVTVPRANYKKKAAPKKNTVKQSTIPSALDLSFARTYLATEPKATIRPGALAGEGIAEDIAEVVDNDTCGTPGVKL